MKNSREYLLIAIWLVIGLVLLGYVSPGDVEIPYAEY